MLEDATGLRARGLINVFGDKDALFVRILRIYRGKAADILARVFDPPSADAVIGLFNTVTAPKAETDPANSGCLMVNTIFELGFELERTSKPVRLELFACQRKQPCTKLVWVRNAIALFRDSIIAKNALAVDAYREMFRQTFRKSLHNSGIDKAAERGDFLLALLWGALSQIRLIGNTEATVPLATVVVETVRGWQTAAGANRSADSADGAIPSPAATKSSQRGTRRWR